MTCNKILGMVRDDPDRVQRMLGYLTAPPAWAIIGKVKVIENKDNRSKPSRSRYRRRRS